LYAIEKSFKRFSSIKASGVDMAKTIEDLNAEQTQIIKEAFKNNFERLPLSDRVLSQKIRKLPTGLSENSEYQPNNPYKECILSYFDSLICLNNQTYAYSDYATLKLRLLNNVLKELWVIQARKGETFKLFKNFETYEKVLFQSNPEYRDHYIHQFDVFLLGYYFLNEILVSDTEISEIFKPYPQRKPNLTWMLTSTFHDIGYPIEKIDEWFASFLNTFLRVETAIPIEIEKILSPVFFDYLRYLSEEHYNQTSEPMTVSGTCYLRDWRFHSVLVNNLRMKKDHGIVSSLLLIHSLFTQEHFSNFHDWFFESFEPDIMPACHAIAIHHLKIDFERISLKKSPFAFLLVLCDSIQDWQRSIDGENPSELKDITISFSETPEIKIDLDLSLNYDKYKWKYDELDELKKRLNTDNLIKITIKQSNGNREWSL
jgi:hypothetical protein